MQKPPRRRIALARSSRSQGPMQTHNPYFTECFVDPTRAAQLRDHRPDLDLSTNRAAIRAAKPLGKHYATYVNPTVLTALNTLTDALLIRDLDLGANIRNIRCGLLQSAGAVGLEPFMLPRNHSRELFVAARADASLEATGPRVYGPGRPMGSKATADAKASPEFLAVGCVAGEMKVTLRFIDQVATRISPDLMAELARPQYLAAWAEHPPVHVATSQLALLHMHEGRLLTRYAENVVWCAQAEGQAAIKALQKCIQAARSWEVTLNPGDVLLLRNHRVLHGISGKYLLTAARRTFASQT